MGWPRARHISQLHKFKNYDKKHGFCCDHPLLPITDPEQREHFLRELHDAIAADSAILQRELLHRCYNDVTSTQREIPFEDMG